MLSIQKTKHLFQFQFHQVKSSQRIFLCIMAFTLLLDLPVQMILRQLPQLEILWPIHPPGLVRMWEDSGRVNNLSQTQMIFQKLGDFSEMGLFYERCVCLPVCAPDGDP